MCTSDETYVHCWTQVQIALVLDCQALQQVLVVRHGLLDLEYLEVQAHRVDRDVPAMSRFITYTR